MRTALRWTVLLLALVGSVSARPAAPTLSPDERRIVEFVDAHTGDAEALLETTVNIESPTENVAGVRHVGDVFGAELGSLGFRTRWLDMPAEMGRAGHLVAEKSGTKGKRVLLLGHLDTVLSGERYRRDGTKAYGTGSSDMKGGDVVIVYALKALGAAGVLADAGVVVILTGDEENTGRPNEARVAGLIDAAKRSDVALSFDGGDRSSAVTAERGQSFWELEVTAKSGHSSRIFRDEVGCGAILEASRILDQFYAALHDERYLSFNPGAIAGGSEVDDDGKTTLTARGRGSVVSTKAVVFGDLRFLSTAQQDAARAKMRAIVAASLPGTSAKVTFSDGPPAMPPTAGNEALLKELDAVSRDLDFGPVAAAEPVGGAGDIAEVAFLLPCLDDLGALGGNEHVRGEYVELDTLPMQIKRAALLIYRLTR